MSYMELSKPIIHDEFEQGSPEWLQARCGMLTASNVKKLFTKAHQTANNDTSRGHAHDVLAGRLTGHVEDNYKSDDMHRGDAEEIVARNIYTAKHAPVKQVGFITRKFEIDGICFTLGYSPDGLVGELGSIEIKSRLQRLQVRTIVDGGVPDEYKLQIQTGLLVSGREWCDFVSVCCGMPLYTYRMRVDADLQLKIIAAALAFEGKVQQMDAEYTDNARDLVMTERIEPEPWGISGIEEAS